MTYRDRREVRTARLREWADKRHADVAAVHAAQEPFRGDIAFNTQPGRIPARERMNRQLERAWESTKTADRMSEKAANIEAATDHAIYSDDPDAIERLQERIAGLEAKRGAIKAYNASCKKGTPDLSLLSDDQKRGLELCLRYQAHACKHGAFPGYATTNLAGNIRRLRLRLEALQQLSA